MTPLEQACQPIVALVERAVRGEVDLRPIGQMIDGKWDADLLLRIAHLAGGAPSKPIYESETHKDRTAAEDLRRA